MSNAILVHLGVSTGDLDRSLRFWRDLLGFEIVETRGKLVILSDGLHNITVFERNGGPRPIGAGEEAALHIGVRVDYLHLALQQCLELGLEITCDDIDRCQPYDPANPPRESFKAENTDGIVVDFTASKRQWLGVTI